ATTKMRIAAAIAAGRRCGPAIPSAAPRASQTPCRSLSPRGQRGPRDGWAQRPALERSWLQPVKCVGPKACRQATTRNSRHQPRPDMPPRFAAPLVIRFGAFGDMVLLTPLLHMLHHRYGPACRVLGSGDWLAPLFDGHPDVGAILKLSSRKRPYWLDASQRHLVSMLRAQPPGPVYVCDDYSIDKIRWLLQRARIPADHCVFANPDCLLREREHWIDRWHRFGAMTPAAFASAPAADVRQAPKAPCLVVQSADRADLHAWLRAHAFDDAPLLLLQPGNKRTLKRGRAGQLGDDKQW